MSNSRRIRQPHAKRMPCAHCGHGIRPGKGVGLPDGRRVCDRCADGGVLERRLDCGCLSVPGLKVINEGGAFRCTRHAHAATIEYLTRRTNG